jgi:hypothetical protein
MQLLVINDVADEIGPYLAGAELSLADATVPPNQRAVCTAIACPTVLIRARPAPLALPNHCLRPQNAAKVCRRPCQLRRRGCTGPFQPARQGHLNGSPSRHYPDVVCSSLAVKRKWPLISNCAPARRPWARRCTGGSRGSGRATRCLQGSLARSTLRCKPGNLRGDGTPSFLRGGGRAARAQRCNAQPACARAGLRR